MVIPLYVNSSVKERSLVGMRKVVTAWEDSDDECSGLATPGPAVIEEKFEVVGGIIFGNGGEVRR